MELIIKKMLKILVSHSSKKLIILNRVQFRFQSTAPFSFEQGMKGIHETLVTSHANFTKQLTYELGHGLKNAITARTLFVYSYTGR